MSADPAAGNRPHTRPEFDQIRFNCAADRSPNVLEMHARGCVRAYVHVRAYMWGSESRVTRYDVVSRDNAGMLGGQRDEGTWARQNGLRGANTFGRFARRGRIDVRTYAHMRAYVRTYKGRYRHPLLPPLRGCILARIICRAH